MGSKTDSNKAGGMRPEPGDALAAVADHSSPRPMQGPVVPSGGAPPAGDDHSVWSISRLLREAYPQVRLRRKVIEHPLLESVTLGAIRGHPALLEDFLNACRLLPQCGISQLDQLRGVLVHALSAPATDPEIGNPAPAAPAGATPVESDAPPLAPAPLPLQGMFYPDYISAVEDIYLRMWRLAQFEPFIYAATSVHDFVKTRAVMELEIADRQDMAQYSARLRTLRAASRLITGAKGLFLFDKQALLSIFKRHGRYSALSHGDVMEQHQALRALVDEAPDGIDCIVSDFDAVQLSAVTVVADNVVLSVMGGYAAFRDTALSAQVRARSLAARRRGCSLSSFLDQTG